MADTRVVSGPAATSWGAVIGGWGATIGASAIFGGWLGGLLAPSRAVYAAPRPVYPVVPRPSPLPREERRVVEQRSRRTMMPAFGRKGGERMVDDDEHRVDEVHTEHVEKDVRKSDIDRG